LCTFPGPKQLHSVFSANLHAKSTVGGHFTAAIGHALMIEILLFLDVVGHNTEANSLNEANEHT
jgi:hypothetical protein